MESPVHQPVLLNETLDLLNLSPGNHVVDGTLGLGGHSLAMLQLIGKKGRLLAFEQDERNLSTAKERLKKYAPQITFAHRNFEELKAVIDEEHFPAPDAILLDLGLSSPHVDDANRGFSFKSEGPLDMRFDPRTELTAEEVVNKMSERKLYELIRDLGEEPRAFKIAKAIVQARAKQPIQTTTQLANLILEMIKNPKFPPGRRAGKKALHPATKTFQALRMHVNRELDVLQSVLTQAIDVLAPGGRLAVISYHSLEDRLVKTILKAHSDLSKHNKYINETKQKNSQPESSKNLSLLTKKPIIPKGIEVSNNPRARSAKLRGAQKL